jgi:integrase
MVGGGAWRLMPERQSFRSGVDVQAKTERQVAGVIDPYAMLGIERDAESEAIRLAWRKAAIKGYPIAEMDCGNIKSEDIVALARTLSKERQPQTVGNYLSHLGAIFAIARPAWGYPLDKQAMADAHAVIRRLGLSSSSIQRERRPSLAELDKILQHFVERKERVPQAMPMHKIILFAMFSTRRQEEITRIAWEDFEPTNKRVLVRDMKNPGEKIGNHVWCDLPAEAIAVIETMGKTKAEIFPYSADAISKNFTDTCKLLEIDDLHFHDLRHEGVSRLFEMGWTIPHVATVSGHKSWKSLQRYSHVRQTGDKYAGWVWLNKLNEMREPVGGVFEPTTP